jgi:hypothetical protein
MHWSFYVTSVASGWHYATDGIVGAALATAIYAWLARRARQSPEQAAGAPAESQPVGAWPSGFAKSLVGEANQRVPGERVFSKSGGAARDQ